ncbi:MAG: BNR-repeat neuraminidase N-terminal domain-containing protein, partial [Bacteroidia bacterium]
MRNLITAFLTLLFFTVSAQEKIVQQKYQLPLLIGKEFNPVLRLAIPVKTAKTLTGISITIPSNADDIESVQLFAVHQDSAFITDSKLKKADLVARTNGDKGKELHLKGDFKLKAGENYFWITLTLKASANLQHTLNLSVNNLLLDGEKIKVNQPKAVAQHVAVALRQHNEENVHTHRIPGLTTANDGSLLAVYDARRTKGGDLQGDIDIGLSRSLDKGKTWLPMQVVLDMGEWGGLLQKFNGVSDACILV